LEAEFNEAELLPKTKEAAIMAAAAYIAANASNVDEHMRHLRNLALEGVRVLQGTNEQGHDTNVPYSSVLLVHRIGVWQLKLKSVLSKKPLKQSILGCLRQKVEWLGGKFQSLQANLAKGLVEWDDNYKSQSAKEVLIKAIAQAIPLYVMSVFKLPLGLCDELTKMMRRFWWGAKKGKRKTH
jgi:hypothetical protein